MRDPARILARDAAARETDIVVVGAGQAGLSAAYHLKRLGLAPVTGFVVLDGASRPGGAWQHRWPSLTLSTVNRIHDLPGMAFAEAQGADATEVRASVAVPRYFEAYEEDYTRDYRTADALKGEHVIVVGGGISANQLLDEVSRVATTTWVTRRPPEFRSGPFDQAAGRRAVAQVEERVRRGLQPASVVSVTGLSVTPTIEAMRDGGVLERRPMFDEILEEGVRWSDGTVACCSPSRTSSCGRCAPFRPNPPRRRCAR